MFLLSQFDEFLTIAIVAILIISVVLVIYYIVTGRKKDDEPHISPNFETKNIPNQPVTTNNNYQQTIPENVIPVQENNSFHEPVSNQNSTFVPPKEDEALKKAEDAKTDDSIQKLLNQMQHDLDNSTTEEYVDSLSRYENEEEENAIISYTELMKYKENREKDIVLHDRDKEEIMETIKEEPEEFGSREEVKKFKRSEFISPIFGYNDDSNVTYRESKRPPRKETKVQDSESEWQSDRMLKELQDETAEVIDFDQKEQVEEKTIDDKNNRFLDELVDFRNKLN